MKTTKIMKWGLLVILFSGIISLSIYSCKKTPDPNTGCNVYGTFVSIPCGGGLFGNLWIRLDNDQLLQPCQIASGIKLEVKEGQRVKLAYTEISQSNCPNMMACAIAVPNHKTIRITCMELQGSGNSLCTLTGTLKDYNLVMNRSCGWVLEADNNTKIEVYGFPQGFTPKDGMRVKFGYTPIYTFAATCVGSAGQITCIEEIKAPAPACKAMLIDYTQNLKDIKVAGLNISKAWIDGNCLKITCGFSGCNSAIERFNLEWNGSMTKSFPPKVSLYVTDKFDVTCLAVFTNTLSFDISQLKMNSNQQVSITLNGWASDLVY